MTDIILRTRIDALKENLREVAGVLDSVKERRKEIQDLQSLLAAPAESILASIVKIKNEIHSTKGRLELEGDEFDDILSSLDQALNEVEGALNHARSARKILDKMKKRSVEIEGTGIGVALVETAANEIKAQAEKCNETLGSIQDLLEKATVEEKKGDVPKAEALRSEAWKGYADMVYELDRQHVFAEYVDFKRGLAMRDTGLDEGICQIADELISKLKILDVDHSLTIPVLQEAVTMTLARFIRLGFPEWTLWAIPLTAHELGYVVVSKNDVLKVFIKEHAQNEQSMDYLRHYLADAFATYAMGPAYACAAILLRFNPISAYKDKNEYPADAKRVHVVLTMLDRMNKKEAPMEPYTPIINILEGEWKAALLQAKSAGTLEAMDKELLGSCVTFMWKFLGDTTLVAYPAKNWANIQGWRDKILQNQVDDIKVEGKETWRDVLNAALLCRIHDPAKEKDIANAAFKLWGRIVDQKKLIEKPIAARTRSRPGE